MKLGNNYHFIGIGGAGMSALAVVLLEMGLKVSGSDIKESHYTRRLSKLGAKVDMGHYSANIAEPEAVVVSSAIRKDNPELLEALQKKIPVLHRSDLMGILCEQKKAIAVAGSHGKTTTSSLMALMLKGCGCEPSYMVGGELNDIGTNAEHGSGDLMVVEADESDGSFLKLSPEYAVVTNIDNDHMDHYGTDVAIKEAFVRFISQTKNKAFIWEEIKDKLPDNLNAKVESYGFSNEADCSAEILGMSSKGSRFNVRRSGKTIGEFRIKLVGSHNVLNALSVILLGLNLGLEVKDIQRAISGFKGVRRRFQKIGTHNGITVIDDYAHHPAEIAVTLEAAKLGEWERIVVVFQPHRYSRTYQLRKEFSKCFTQADMLIISDIYGAGEEPLPGVNGKLIVDSVLIDSPRSAVAYLPSKKEIVTYLNQTSKKGDLIMTVGAGDISSIGEELLKSLNRS